eukprot:748274-Hanusia_phi.AAC.3
MGDVAGCHRGHAEDQGARPRVQACTWSEEEGDQGESDVFAAEHHQRLRQGRQVTAFGHNAQTEFAREEAKEHGQKKANSGHHFSWH